MVILLLGEQYSVELQQHNELKLVNVNTSANAQQISGLVYYFSIGATIRTR